MPAFLFVLDETSHLPTLVLKTCRTVVRPRPAIELMWARVKSNVSAETSGGAPRSSGRLPSEPWLAWPRQLASDCEGARSARSRQPPRKKPRCGVWVRKLREESRCCCSAGFLDCESWRLRAYGASHAVPEGAPGQISSACVHRWAQQPGHEPQARSQRQSRDHESL